MNTNNKNNEYVIAIDITTNLIKIALYDENYNCKDTVILLMSDKYTQITKFTADLIKKINEGYKDYLDKKIIKSIGISSPNGNYQERVIEKTPNLPFKNRMEICEILKSSLDIDTYVINDTKACGLAELEKGTLKKDKNDNFIFVIIDAGVGFCQVINGKFNETKTGISNEYGHFNMMQSIHSKFFDRTCGCGQTNCLEVFASEGGIKNNIKEILSKSENYQLSKTYNEFTILKPSISEIINLYKNKEEIAIQQGIKISIRLISEVLKFLYVNSAFDSVILSGSVGKNNDFAELLGQELKKELKTSNLIVKPTELKENYDPSMLGAAVLAWKNYNKEF